MRQRRKPTYQCELCACFMLYDMNTKETHMPSDMDVVAANRSNMGQVIFVSNRTQYNVVCNVRFHSSEKRRHTHTHHIAMHINIIIFLCCYDFNQLILTAYTQIYFDMNVENVSGKTATAAAATTTKIPSKIFEHFKFSYKNVYHSYESICRYRKTF